MSAPPEVVDLTDDQPWRAIPMPGSEQQLEIVRLASPRDRLTIHGRFPAGFERPVVGGYAVSEEFLVLEGELEVSGAIYLPGDLVVVPAWYPRTGMRSPSGARVLAWFGGPAEFLPAAELQPCAQEVTRVAVDDVEAGPLPGADAGAWALGAEPVGDGIREVVDAARRTWRRGEQASTSLAPRDLVRRER